ncbi:MAG: hypothetical protein RIT45_2790 [Pseudomonadota bacterium]|jgi:ABC-type transporter Mla maintaining outer membrane lipid asymmetry ATPase subunit MlaF
MSTTPLLRTEGAVIDAGGQRIGPLDWSVDAGETLWLSAPAGGSKSVVLRALVGMEPLEQGHIHLLGHDLGALSPIEQLALRQRVGFVPQSGALLSNLGLEANLALLARHHLGLEGEALAERLTEVAVALDLPSLAGRRLADAEPSLVRRVAIGRVLALRPPLLLLDEPAWAVDAGRADAFWSALERLRATSRIGMVIASAFPPRRFVQDLRLETLRPAFRKRRRSEAP